MHNTNLHGMESYQNTLWTALGMEGIVCISKQPLPEDVTSDNLFI